MACAISIDKVTQIILVRFAGDVDLQDKIAAVENVCTTYQEYRPFRILVDVRAMHLTASAPEQEAFGRFLASHPGLSDASVAVLHPNGFNPNIRIDTTAFALGYMLTQHTSLTEAQQWLIEHRQSRTSYFDQ